MRNKLFGLPLALGMAISAAALAADYGMPPDVERGAMSRCADRWPTDFAMQAACMRNQSRGYKELGLQPYPSIETVTVDFARETEKTRLRKEAGYRDPPGTRVLTCGAGYRETDRDGCQPR